jgi:hypothetical protein
VKTLSPLFADACSEAAELSFAVGVEHLVLSLAKAGALGGIDAETVRERIVDDQRSLLATFGISFDAVHERVGPDAGCLPITPETKRMLELATRRRPRELTPERLLATLLQHSPTARRLLSELHEAR